MEVLARAVRQEKNYISHPNQKERSKIVFADDMSLCMESPKDYTKTLLELIKEFSKVAECKINIQKSVLFPYTNSKPSEK